MHFTLFAVASLLAASVSATPVERATEVCTVYTEGRLTGPTDDNFQIAKDGQTVQFGNASDPVGLDAQFMVCNPNYGGFNNNGTSVAFGGGIGPIQNFGHIYIPSHSKCLYVNELLTPGVPLGGGPVYQLQIRACSLVNDKSQIGLSWQKYYDDYYWIGGSTAAGAVQDGTTCPSGQFDYTRVAPPIKGQPVTLGCQSNADQEPFRIGAANPVL